ncbi:MAG: hypothetical protein ABW044_05395 [Cellvibrio sp.]
MNSFVITDLLYLFGILMAGLIMFNRVKPICFRRQRGLIFLNYQDLDRCANCRGLLHDHRACKCGNTLREKVIVIKRTYNDNSTEWEVIDMDEFKSETTGVK